jgi:hypothetical protein
MSIVRTTLLAGLVALAFAAASSASTIIYQHSFGGFGSPLNGVATDVGGQNWVAGPAFLDDGTVATTVASSANGNAAWLPFTPQDLKVYTLEATIRNNFSDWIGVGFFPLNPSATANWSDTNFSVRHSNAPGWAWAFTRNHATSDDQTGFNGSGTANTAFTGNLVSPANPVAFKIILNTMNPQWTAQYFLNGVQQGATFNIGNGSHDGAGTDDIRGVGFSRDRNATAGTGGSVSAFSLTSIPEPGTCLLAMIGLVGIGAIRRRTNC